MSKAIFFDWDDTLALKLRGGEVLAARKEFGDSLVLIDDGENKNCRLSAFSLENRYKVSDL